MRIFAAFDISDEFKSKLWDSIKSLNMEFDNLNWVNPQNYHITLKFYGNVGDLKRVTDNCKNFAQNLERFPIEWKGFSFFSHKVFFASLKITPFKIVRSIRHELNSDFSPHITLARNKFGVEFKERISEKTGSIIVSHSEIIENMTIYESILKNTGPEYRVIEKIRL